MSTNAHRLSVKRSRRKGKLSLSWGSFCLSTVYAWAKSKRKCMWKGSQSKHLLFPDWTISQFKVSQSAAGRQMTCVPECNYNRWIRKSSVMAKINIFLLNVPSHVETLDFLPSSAAKIAIDTQRSSPLRWKVHAGFGRRNSGKEDHKGGFNPIMPEANRKKMEGKINKREVWNN